MTISIIIPTYNEKGELEKCIESLGFQAHNDFEIVVVDDGSSDKTLEVLQNLQLSIRQHHLMRNFQFFEQKHQGAGAARNLGAKQANGNILVFVDADMTFDKNFLEKLVEPIEKGLTKGTFSKEEYVANWDNIWARSWNTNEGWEDKRRHSENYPDHQPVFRAILKSEFDKVGGFTPGGYDDDWSLSKKLKYEASAASGAVFYHNNPDGLIEVFKQASWVGKRKYKLGRLGMIFTLLKASLPHSLIVGVLKSIRILNFNFLVFKVVYDFGIFVGILEMLLLGKKFK